MRLRTLLVVVATAVAALLLLLPRTDRADALDCAGTVASPTTGEADSLNLALPQLDVAKRIVATAKGMAITKRGAVIALQVARQESTFDPAATVGRATGAFQQIAPGPADAYVGYDRTDPGMAAKGFFTVLLARVPGYDSDPRSNADIGQVVQASGAGAGKYAPWQPLAESLADVLYDGTAAMTCAAGTSGPTAIRTDGTDVELPPAAGVTGSVKAPTPEAARALAAALSWLGTPYAWGGGTTAGPSRGIRDGGVADAHGDFAKVGFDCSGLMVYAYGQVGVSLPRTSQAQRAGGGTVVPWSAALPGDLVFYGSVVHHVAMFLGVVGGVPYMVEAPQSGDVVKVSPVRTGGDFRSEAVRPIPGEGPDQHA
ncbi:C40 family peptidase [Amycolatopsis mongoliensis]|uniref:C40 family peptidase n=1 Tax=Amycolatopsis mongoliensis TaxID=715475 RepID=A0A9Y2JGS3_9PSEU|nr:C40 family peptidase [Amycolatopsis sp. 4-36]WIX98182.1 C40 family peptidase [Amycolatopsis sp. 4-36]